MYQLIIYALFVHSLIEPKLQICKEIEQSFKFEFLGGSRLSFEAFGTVKNRNTLLEQS